MFKFLSRLGSPIQQDLDSFYKSLNQANQIIDEIKISNQQQMDILNGMDRTLNNPVIKVNPMSSTEPSLWQQFVERGKWIEPGNTPDNPLFSTDFWANFVMDVIGKTTAMLFQSLINLSSWVCVIVAVAGLLAYVLGYRKGLIMTSGSIAFYIIVRLIKFALGV